MIFVLWNVIVSAFPMNEDEIKADFVKKILERLKEQKRREEIMKKFSTPYAFADVGKPFEEKRQEKLEGRTMATLFFLIVALISVAIKVIKWFRNMCRCSRLENSDSIIEPLNKNNDHSNNLST